MAETLLLAAKETYEGLSGLPALSAETKAERAAITDAVLEDMGESEVYDKAGPRYSRNRFRICLWHSSVHTLRGLMKTIRDGFTPLSLSIDDKRPYLTLVNASSRRDEERGKVGEFVYRADIEYEAYVGGVS